MTYDIVAVDRRMSEILERLKRIASSDAIVLIQGESGSGKEVVARELHRMRHGEGAPFVAVNCAALPEQLLESELFGHEKGAFTGANERKIGLIEAASGGTLFLDEIGEMPLSLQPKLLRVLETREVTRLGSVKAIAVTASFVAATNRDLASAVRAGSFRQDLYYRLSVVPVTIPPLRERPADLDEIIKRMLATFRIKFGKPGLSFSKEALAALKDYDWPGNVRELRNTIERACILAEGDVIEVSDLGLPIASSSREGEGLLARVERETILKVLDECAGNRRQAAARLGISLRTLQYRLKEYGMV